MRLLELFGEIVLSYWFVSFPILWITFAIFLYDVYCLLREVN